MDKYKNYSTLRRNQNEGKDYQIHVRQAKSGVAVIAPHGGGIEPGTSEIADAVAGREHSFYTFEGIKKKKNSNLHITSEKFDEPTAAHVVGKSRVILSLHGCEGDQKAVYVGGLDQDLSACVKRCLVDAGFPAIDSPNPGLAGTSPSNICNRGQANKGVQLELTRALRREMFASLKRSGRVNKTETFHEFVSVLREALSESLSEGN